MAEGHEKFEQFALRHVLGGLLPQDAAEFRNHLIGCRDCRMRVVELRDMAADLAATEREERRSAAVTTQVARASDDDADGTVKWTRWMQVGVALAIVAIVAILFWNFHLRRVTGAYHEAVTNQARVLEAMADGDPVPVDTREGVRATAAVHDGVLAVTLTRLPDLPDGYALVAWLLADGKVVADPKSLAHARNAADADPLPFTVNPRQADSLVVSVEPALGGEGEMHGERVLATVKLPASPVLSMYLVPTGP